MLTDFLYGLFIYCKATPYYLVIPKTTANNQHHQLTGEPQFYLVSFG